MIYADDHGEFEKKTVEKLRVWALGTRANLSVFCAEQRKVLQFE